MPFILCVVLLSYTLHDSVDMCDVLNVITNGMPFWTPYVMLDFV